MKRDPTDEGLLQFRVKLAYSCGVAYAGTIWAKGWAQALAMAKVDARMLSTNPMPEGELIAQSAIRA